VIAAVVVFAAAAAYLRSFLVYRVPRKPYEWAGVATALIIVLPPLVVFFTTLGDDKDPFPTEKPTSELDVVVVGAGRSAPHVNPSRELNGWVVRSWAGRAQGRSVRWSSGPPQLSKQADKALLLFVDGAPNLSDTAPLPDLPARPGEVRRWLAIADQAAGQKVPTFALLQSSNPARLAGWKKRLKPADDGKPGRRRGGDAYSLKDFSGSETIDALALSLAVDGPTAKEDLALALQYRPALFFDSKERYATPLNVDRALESGAFRLCDDHQAVLASCKEVHGADELENGPNHLGFETRQVAELTDDSTIYVHVTPDRRFGTTRKFLDYWWYLPDNPTNGADGALCGAGLVIAEITCFDHQSDWEGVTVVVDPSSRSPSPVEVHYSQHNFRVRYTWPALIDLWSRRSTSPFASKVDTTFHPLVFVASGTHAAYPTVCTRKHCPAFNTSENRHNGGKPWPENDDARPEDNDRACNSLCVAALPTGAGGKAARWNAYQGHWGTTRCNLVLLCSSTKTPRSPAQQSRYKYPWCATPTVVFKRGRARYESKRVAPDDCPKKPKEHK
jgi:hypothetical protein